MPHTMLRFPTVKARTGLSRSTIYLRISRGTFPAPVSLGGPGRGLDRGRGARVAHRADRATPADSRPRSGGSSHDPAQEGGPAMTPRHTAPAPVAHGSVRALAHGRGRGRPGAGQTVGAPQPERRTAAAEDGWTGRGDAPPVPQRKGGRHDPEHHCGRRGGARRGHGRGIGPGAP